MKELIFPCFFIKAEAGTSAEFSLLIIVGYGGGIEHLLLTYYVVDAKCIIKFVIMCVHVHLCVCGAQRLASDVLENLFS